MVLHDLEQGIGGGDAYVPVAVGTDDDAVVAALDVVLFMVC
jgi:hypothetical protein